MSWRIFISYRRRDLLVLAYTASLYRALDRIFPNQVFRDEQELPLGQPFPDQLQDALAKCEAMLVCIHDPANWRQGESSTLWDEGDWVRREVATALTRGIAVVPVIFDPRGRMPRPDELPDVLQPLLLQQAVTINVSKGDWETRQLPELVEKLRSDMPVPSDRHILADELHAILCKLESQAGRALSGIPLARLYLSSVGLEMIPDVIKRCPARFSLAEAVGVLKGFKGNQIFSFGRGCQRHFGIEPTAGSPLNTWLQRDPQTVAAPLSESEASGRLRVQFVLNPKSHWQARCESLQVHGSLRLGPHAIRITSEELPEAICIPGKSMELVLEPVMIALVQWLDREVGREMVRELAPRIEFFAIRIDDRLGDPLNWPFERVPLADCLLGEMFSICLRLYRRHLGCSLSVRDEWQKRSKHVETASLSAPEFFPAADWTGLRLNPMNLHKVFVVTNGTADIPDEELIRRAYPAGYWSRRNRPEWDLGTALLICSGTKPLASLPDCLREVRCGAPADSPWHDVAVLYDPCEETRPHDPCNEPDQRKATRSASLL